MFMKKQLLSLVMLAGMVLAPLTFAAAPVHACSCLPFESFTQAAEMSDVIIYGNVVSTKGTVDGAPGSDEVSYEVEAYEFWGELAEGVNTITTSGSSAACGINLTQGAEYIIIASRDESGMLSTGLCSGTQDATEANLETLRAEMGPGMAFFYTQGQEPGAPDRPAVDEPGVDPTLYDNEEVMPISAPAYDTSAAAISTIWAAVACVGLMSTVALLFSSLNLVLFLKGKK
ncbi:MAG: Tissue inhibitor of metalloproteinase [candidate division WS6 bacterium OLB20]|uniref:Tissue inhibitor of metalloproteinase n=1 Tax=candidate division WS6 bacterium OLB20 TaxID=1617426 RepID=A0A136LWP8_9BACT|nr:MAG: Tissue inhibitor of metalloproteinase [candidate division WS6 bacterium OLB20]